MMFVIFFLFQPNFKSEITWGFLYPFIRDLREAHRRVAPTTLINALLFTVVTCLVLKVWWRRTGRKFWWDSQVVFFWDQRFCLLGFVESVEKALTFFFVGYSQKLPLFNRERSEKFSIKKRELYHRKLVAIETVDPNAQSKTQKAASTPCTW